MSSTNTTTCTYCNRECKSSDSRPYPTSKSKDRIHNKCQIKKTLADKRQTDPEKGATQGLCDVASKIAVVPATLSLADRIAQDEIDIKRAINESKLSKLNDKSQKITEATSQCFFDLKAGIAKPHEKRRYLTHRNICEIAARYDDNGFSEEAVGRAYDHQGRDLNSLGDSDDEAEQVDHESVERSNQAKRKGDRPVEKYKADIKRPKVQVDEKNPCWFCLSSPQVEKHLIIAIGDFCYLSLAKGGLDDEHFLLLPIEHIQSLNDSANSTDLLQELERFKKSLVEYFGAKSMGVVFFERNFRSVHWQLQVVPVPLWIIDTIESDIKSLSKLHFKNSNYLDIPEDCSLSDMIPPNEPYFYWHLEPNGSRFVTQIQVRDCYFPIQLGRLVLTNQKILNCEDKIDWKKCSKSKEEYVDLVKKIKTNYASFDIT